MEVADAHGVHVPEGSDTDPAAVHGPMPGTAWRRRYASANGMSTIASNVDARPAIARMRSARRRSTPSVWYDQ